METTKICQTVEREENTGRQQGHFGAAEDSAAQAASSTGKSRRVARPSRARAVKALARRSARRAGKTGALRQSRRRGGATDEVTCTTKHHGRAIGVAAVSGVRIGLVIGQRTAVDP